MLAYAALGLLAFGALYLLGRWFVRVSAQDLAQALRSFAAVFSALASTGLLLTGRLGLAVITVAATVMAVRSLVTAGRGGGAGAAGAGPGSAIETRMLAMRLDHATGEVEGRVKLGAFAGRELAELGIADLLALLEEAIREDPRSRPLLEAYLDRRDPDWRARAAAGGEGGPDSGPDGSGGAVMDDRTALEILGLAPGADAAAIKAAHRRLMAKLHPDHGGSTYLAGQINRARDHLLKG